MLYKSVALPSMCHSHSYWVMSSCSILARTEEVLLGYLIIYSTQPLEQVVQLVMCLFNAFPCALSRAFTCSVQLTHVNLLPVWLRLWKMILRRKEKALEWEPRIAERCG